MRRDDGQATVEMALLLPILVVLAMLLVQVGGLATDRVRLWHAAREAARVAVVDPDAHGILAAAEHAGLQPISIDVEPGPQDRVQGDPLTVRVTYRPFSDAPIIGSLLDGVTMQASAIMRIEEP